MIGCVITVLAGGLIFYLIKRDIKKEISKYNIEKEERDFSTIKSNLVTAVNSTDIYFTVHTLTKMLTSEKYEIIDQWLSRMDIESFSKLGQIAIIRTLYPSRYKLAFWFSTYDRIYADLEKKGDDPVKVLKGLNIH